MHLEEFARGPSFLHRLDPRVKIIVAVAFSFVIALSDRFAVLWTALAVSAVLVLLARLGVWKVLARLALVNVFILVIWLFLPFSHPGEPVFSIWIFTASREGLLLSLAITVKSNAIVLAAVSMLATSPVFTLVHGLRHLYVPEKLVNLFFFTFRYFQVIHKEYLRLRAAMKVRCFAPRTNMHTYRSIAYLFGMLLVRSFDRSERVVDAMKCRGYDGRLWILDHFDLVKRDVVFLVVMSVFIIILSVGQWTNLIL